MGVVALSFVITEDLRDLIGISGHNLPLVDAILLLNHEFFDTVRVYLEFLMAKFVLCKVLVARDRVVVKSFVRSLEVAQQIVDIGLLEGRTVLSLSLRGKLVRVVLSD